MTNLDSIFKSRDITLPTKVRLVKAMVFPVVTYGCESWTMKKGERRRMDAFELWCWRRLLRVPWTARRSNQSILKGYLLGSAIGSLFAARFVQRMKRPLRTFLLLQCAIAGLAALPTIAVVALPPNGAALGWFVRYWADYNFFPLGHTWDPTSVLKLYVLLPVLLFFAPTVLMGASFPVLQRAVHDAPSASGRRVGFLQAANIAGCAAGSLLVGLVSLHYLGTPGTLRLLVVAGAGFAVVGLRYYGRFFLVPAL